MLVKLDMSNSNLCAPGARALARALKDNQIITALNISNNSLGFFYKPDMNGVIKLAHTLPSMRALVS